MSDRVGIAVAQLECDGTLETALAAAEAAIGEAAAAGARLVAFGETVLPGYPAWLDVCRDAGLWDHAPVKAAFRAMAEQAVTVPGPAVERLASAARNAAITVVIGVIERVPAGPARGTLFNTLLTLGSDGTLLNHHRKLVPTYTERLVWGPGDADGVRAVDTAAGRVGGLICWEHWMPLARQAMHESGEDIHVAAWPGIREMHALASRHYAFEGRCWVLAAGSVMRATALPPGLEPHPERVPSDDVWLLRGGSCIFAPDGEPVAGPLHDAPGLLVVEADLGRVTEEHMNLDVAGHYARPDCFRLARVGTARNAQEAAERARETYGVSPA